MPLQLAVEIAEHSGADRELPFNIGVEVGQLMFVAATLALGWVLRRVEFIPLRPSRFAFGYLIGGLAAMWTIERVARFWL